MPGEHLTCGSSTRSPSGQGHRYRGLDIGVEALGELESCPWGPLWRDVPFESLLRQRQNLVITVTAVDGVVVPAMVFGNEADEAWWPGWGRPPSGSSGGPGRRYRRLPGGAQPGPAAAEVSVDLFTRTDRLSRPLPPR